MSVCQTYQQLPLADFRCRCLINGANSSRLFTRALRPGIETMKTIASAGRVMSDSKDRTGVAYLTSHYPAVSHTFILREVEALQDLGLDVVTYSIRRPPSDHLRGPAEVSAAENTFYVLEAAKRLWPLFAAQARLFRQPKAYLSALTLAFQMRAPGLRALLYQMFYFVEATIIADDLDRRRICHLHNHFADVSANVAILAATLSGIRFSYTLHGPAELFAPEKWSLQTKTARAAFVACISNFARSQAMYFSDPADWPKLKIIHCGVIPETYARAAPPENDDTHFVYVGRLTAIKGVRVLLEAFAQALKQAPHLKLTIVGDGDDRKELEKIAGPLGDRVVFTGYQSQAEVAATLGGADVFVLPSFAEGLPVVLMEALAAAVPVICTQVAGVSDLVEDGTHGFVVPPGDAETLADRMVAISTDADARARMGAAGQAKVAEDFDARREAARLARLFGGDLGGPTRPALLVEKDRG